VATLVQTIFYVVSPLVTLLAVSVAYLALLKQSKPQVLIQYRPNPGIQTLIDLVVENIGGGMARDITFSQPIPARCFGIERPDGPGSEVLGAGLPAIAAGQRYIFDGGQYGGLASKIGDKLEIAISYSFITPLGIKRSRKERCVLSVSHLQNMPTRTSAEQAVVDALKGPNVTTLQEIERELHNIGSALNRIAENGKIGSDEPNKSNSAEAKSRAAD
jgi:hypothetical protein